jgi:hypothetical protein
VTSAFELTITPPRGPEYLLDLSEFALGGKAATVKKTTSWGGDYRGRPAFAAEIVAMFNLLQPNETSAIAIRTGLRLLFRFLDVRERREREVVSTSAGITSICVP